MTPEQRLLHICEEVANLDYEKPSIQMNPYLLSKAMRLIEAARDIVGWSLPVSAERWRGEEIASYQKDVAALRVALEEWDSQQIVTT